MANSVHRVLGLASVALLASSCTAVKPEREAQTNVISGVVARDVTFYSRALNREMKYRIIYPAQWRSDRKLPVVYLLHGAGGSLRDWNIYSKVGAFAKDGLLLVMPQGDYSYYVNAATRPGDRYEDYIVQDLLLEIKTKFRPAEGRANTAIIGISMGGFGAIKIGLSHPDMFAFVGALSPAIDAPRRALRLNRIQQYWSLRTIFGPWGSQSRGANDPFLLAKSARPDRAPYFYIGCGDAEPLLGPNREFIAVLQRQRISYEFHVMPGAHDWTQWNAQLPQLFRALLLRVGAPSHDDAAAVRGR